MIKCGEDLLSSEQIFAAYLLYYIMWRVQYAPQEKMANVFLWKDMETLIIFLVRLSNEILYCCLAWCPSFAAFVCGSIRDFLDNPQLAKSQKNLDLLNEVTSGTSAPIGKKCEESFFLKCEWNKENGELFFKSWMSYWQHYLIRNNDASLWFLGRLLYKKILDQM